MSTVGSVSRFWSHQDLGAFTVHRLCRLHWVFHIPRVHIKKRNDPVDDIVSSSSLPSFSSSSSSPAAVEPTPTSNPKLTPANTRFLSPLLSSPLLSAPLRPSPPRFPHPHLDLVPRTSNQLRTLDKHGKMVSSIPVACRGCSRRLNTGCYSPLTSPVLSSDTDPFLRFVTCLSSKIDRARSCCRSGQGTHPTS
jgi:hypothetical protein